ncbi:MAG: error-prone DNA polymerase [Myxococcaceae bacterium]
MYAELICRSNFSFLQGASHPEELICSAALQGLSALALTDHDGLYAAVKGHIAAKQANLKFLVASQLTLLDGPPVVLYAQDDVGYRHLCTLVSKSRLAHPKGEAGIAWREVAARAQGLIALLPYPDALERVAPLAEAFPGRFYVGLIRTLSAQDEARVQKALLLAHALEVPVCAHNDVHTHTRRRQPLQDVLTAIRHKTTVAAAGKRLFPNAERTLKGALEMKRLFEDHPDAVGRTLEIADACHFSLDSLKHQFSKESLPPGHTPMSFLRQLTFEGLRFRFPEGIPQKFIQQIEHELDLIEKRDFPGYFLTIWDIVRFAREKGILCQGRGSAANSAVCYALKITAIDPVRMGLLFERFLSMNRTEPPDIDVDFEHERREEVLQYVYQKHGRERAGMVSEVICYRGKLAGREVGKAMGLSLDQVDKVSKVIGGFHEGLDLTRLREAGLSANDPRVQKTVELAAEMEGVPRHLSIHVGGFVVTHTPLYELVPIENGSMKDRTVVQWEKDDLNLVNILKVDLLGLGMLTLLRKALELIRVHHGKALTLATIPAEDVAVYDMLCDADSIGVFQVESRAQMNMLPRLKPRSFYDLVIEIGIIRPGPIIGDMVHPYIRRRDGVEPVFYPSPEIERILGKTLGVPLFQEQAMNLAMIAAGFSPMEADQFRRILSHKRAEELMVPYQDKFVGGCLARGYPKEIAETWFRQFRGFSHYGFPESHSASFAIIAYASSYLKRYYPAAFTAAILNSQPMGFYATHTLVEDAKRHGVVTLPIDVNASHWDCTLEGDGPPEGGRGEPLSTWGEGGPPLRLGLRLVKGLKEKTAQRLRDAREAGPFQSIAELARRTRIARHEIARLALVGALGRLVKSRRDALWQLQALGPLDADDLFFGIPTDDTQVELPPLSVSERVSLDYQTTGVSLDTHPLTLLRPELARRGAHTAEGLKTVRPGKRVGVGGMMICRQRPPTAHGFCFLSLEDETGISNLVVEPGVFERFRREILSAVLIYAEGTLEKSGKVINVKVKHLEALNLQDRASFEAPVHSFR